VVEQPADAGGPAVVHRDAQRLASPRLVDSVDRGAGGDELVDDRQALVVGGHHQGADAGLERRFRG
jgi:hypothetical protein